MSRKRSSTKSLDDSSVLVQESPVSSMKQRGNLTGNVRVMRDHVIDVSAFIQHWNGELLEGIAVISEIKNILYRKMNAKKSEVMSYIPLLKAPYEKFENVCIKMKKHVADLAQLCSKISALAKLEELNENFNPLFLTLSASKFVEISQEIYEMYQKELELKICIKEELYFCTEKDTLVFLEAAWLQEPYIEKRANFYHEILMKEIGLSPVRMKT